MSKSHIHYKRNIVLLALASTLLMLIVVGSVYAVESSGPHKNYTQDPDQCAMCHAATLLFWYGINTM